MPVASRTAVMWSRTPVRAIGSSPIVGSSRISSRGALTSAWASSRRRTMPPGAGAGQPVGGVRQADGAQGLGDPCGPLAPGHAETRANRETFSRPVRPESADSCWGTYPSSRRTARPLPGGVVAEDADHARGDRQQGRDAADCGGLARAVGPEQAEDLALPDGQVEPVDRPGAAEGVRQPGAREGVRRTAAVVRHGSSASSCRVTASARRAGSAARRASRPAGSRRATCRPTSAARRSCQARSRASADSVSSSRAARRSPGSVSRSRYLGGNHPNGGSRSSRTESPDGQPHGPPIRINRRNRFNHGHPGNPEGVLRTGGTSVGTAERPVPGGFSRPPSA